MRNLLVKAKHNNKWIEGWYYQCDWKEHEHWLRVQKDSHFTDYAIDPGTLRQPTGMKDKNKIEIFEGDVIRVDRMTFETDNLPSVFKVTYKDAMYQLFDERGTLFYLNLAYVKECEVLGDIYMNEYKHLR